MTSFECAQEARHWLDFYSKDRSKLWALELAESWLNLAKIKESQEKV